LISHAHITQEWWLIANTAMTENQIFLQHKLTLHILQIEHMNTTIILGQKEGRCSSPLKLGHARFEPQPPTNHYTMPHPL
jgi:hypothetical protein